MFDRFMYKFCDIIDNVFSKIETIAINTSTWLWDQRVKILRKKRGRKK
jgi:hypothetical protein